MSRWEYLYIRTPHTRTKTEKLGGEKVEHVYQVEAILNALGADGWEVVGYHYANSYAGVTPAPYFVLKRPAG